MNDSRHPCQGMVEAQDHWGAGPTFDDLHKRRGDNLPIPENKDRWMGVLYVRINGQRSGKGDPWRRQEILGWRDIGAIADEDRSNEVINVLGCICRPKIQVRWASLRSGEGG